MTLYRVFPYDASARRHEPGGPMFAPGTGLGRVGNPGAYRELYVSNTAVGAISEAFGRFDTWKPEVLTARQLPYALATFDLADGSLICNLDNAARLLAYDIAPSAVVARDRDITQAWARRIFDARRWIGIAWWSRYDSQWQSLALWNTEHLRLMGKPEELSTAHHAVREAATALPRRLEP